MMEPEKIQIAIVARAHESAKIQSRLHACGVSPRQIVHVEPNRWAELVHESIGLCIWGTSPDDTNDPYLPDPCQSAALSCGCLNVYVQDTIQDKHSPCVLAWEEFETDTIQATLTRLIDEAQIRQNLRLHETWYRVAVAEGNVGLWWWDDCIDFVYLSKQFQKMLGLATDQLPRNVDAWLNQIHEEDRPQVAHKIRQHLLENSGRFEIECRIRRQDGVYRWFTLSGQQQSTALNHSRILGAAVDITPKKEAELQLSKATDLAQSAIHAKNEFLTNMSHNLRTPLNAILGNAELLQDFSSEPTATDSLDSIRKNCHQLMHLLDDILELSCIEGARPSAKLAKTSLDAILRDTNEIYRQKAVEKGLKLHIHLPNDSPATIYADATRTRQILARLVENAIKFTPAGEVSVDASLLQVPTPTLQFIIRDTGIGIPPSRLETIFEPFNQGDNSTSRSHSGSGLGLSICRRLADILGGSIDVESEVDFGTSFLLRIPVEVPTTSFQERIREDNINEKPKLPRLDGYQVLLVEDGHDNQVILKAFLEKAGASVVLKENGLEAVQWISANRRDTANTGLDRDPRVDVILMDMQMPVMDGYEATRMLRDNGFQKPILAVTAHALSGDRQRCLDAGCDDYFTKPIKRAALVDIVHRYGQLAQHAAATS